MGRYVFKLPDVGEGTAEAEITAWHVKAGDQVKEDAPLVDVMTDKATVEITSPVAGKVLSLKGAPGDMAVVGSEIVIFEVEGEGNEGQPRFKPAQNAQAAPAPKPAPAPVPALKPAEPPAPVQRAPVVQARPLAQAVVARAQGEKPAASPAVRRRARELGLVLDFVPGSGPRGRIVHEDLDAFVKGKGAPQAPRYEKREGVEDIKIIGLRRKIAQQMQEAKRRIPHFAYVEEVDVTELEDLRAHLNANKGASQTKLTLLPFLMRAIIRVLPEFPLVNSRFDDDAGIVHRHDGVHMGIATQTPQGLVVPVVRHAETLDLWAAAAEIARLAEAARAGKAAREELQGSTMTITSLGPLGGIVSTPVINYPEVAIVGVNKIAERPVVREGQIAVRKMMNLSSSFDHRIVDGWDAANFIQRVKALLEHPALMFME